jgi:hypothetical protein
MTRGWAFSIAGGVVLLALAGCGRSFFMDGERAAWRHDAEVACLKSGAVKIGVERIDPIEGPGMCGADFPFKVTALGEAPVMSYADDLRPPAAIPNASSDMPRWPASEPRYAPPQRIAPVEVEPVQSAPVPGEHMRWVPGPPGIDRAQADAPAGQPMSISPPDATPTTTMSPRTAPMRAAPRPPPRAYQGNYPRAATRPDDIPADAIIPPGGSAAVPAPRKQGAYNAPVYQQPPQRREPPRLGPMRGPYKLAAIPAATLTPAAKLACPIVSALDRWVSEGVQPAALRWFGSPVTEIHQIGSYSCRGMVGGSGVSEHAFGNALDIAGFTLANGRKITVKNGWHGTPEEQGFLHDVQLYACETFVTVLAPGYNVYHYDHIHVDLMRRESEYRPCRPNAIPGEVAAAKARAHYASHHRGPAYTGSIGVQTGELPAAIPGADGYVAGNDGDMTGSVAAPHDGFGAAAGKPSAPAGQNTLGSERYEHEVY